MRGFCTHMCTHTHSPIRSLGLVDDGVYGGTMTDASPHLGTNNTNTYLGTIHTRVNPT